MNLGLHDKHAIVTGGSRGIGKAIARELAREGVDVAIVARNPAGLEATASELATETNRRIVPLVADVTSKEQVDRMVAEAAQQLGGLHILVNSGSAPGGSATATGPIETVVDEVSMGISSTLTPIVGAPRYEVRRCPLRSGCHHRVETGKKARSLPNPGRGPDLPRGAG
jgi:NAD(P)-dependent dehydrogenase (short-subunit alcohol dehydrogenase family)